MTGKSDNKTFINVLITLGSLALVVIGLIWPDRITIAVVILFSVAILPWANNFMRSLEIGTGGMKAEFETLKKDLEGIVDAQSDPEPGEGAEAGALKPAPVELTEEEMLVLNQLVHSKYTLRSVSGITKGSGLPHATVISTLGPLVEKGQANRIHGKKGLRWGISPEGRHALESS
jgi:hypothetical protein